MTDVLTPLGSVSIADMIPAPVIAINLALPDLQARLDAMLAFTPPAIDFAANLSLLAEIKASIEGAIALGITPPSIAAQLAIMAGLIRDLTLQLNAILAITGLFANAGIYAYAYDGAVNGLGPALTAELGAGLPGGLPSDHCNALVMVTSVAATWTGMSVVFKVT
jgi:hypothetical protein